MTQSNIKGPIFIGLFLFCFIPLCFSSQAQVNQTQTTLSNFTQFLTDPIYGPKDTRFVFIEYADYQCPYCKQLHQTLTKWFSKKYQQQLNTPFKVNWVFRHLPILGEKSILKAQTAICVMDELGNDAFWQFNNLLFTQPIKSTKQLSYQQSLWLMASKQDWDIKKLMQCDFEQNYHTKLKSLARQSALLNIGATPSWFFLDLETGKVIVGSGNLNLDQLDQLFLKQTKNSIKE